MSAHTPGPWKAVYDGSSTWSIGAENEPQSEPPYANIWDRDDERAAANASLIAAAPEMLSALQAVVRVPMAAVELARAGVLDQVSAAIARAVKP